MATALKFKGCLALTHSMQESDRTALMERVDQYKSDGVPADRSYLMAAKDMLEEIRGEREQLHSAIAEQHPDVLETEAAEPAEITQSRRRQVAAEEPSKIFGREVAPVAMASYESLSQKGKDFVDGWNMNWDRGQGALRQRDTWREVVEAYQPVRDKLRELYGDRVPAYRGERNGREASPSDRFLFSWTPIKNLATQFAINRSRGMPAEIPQSKVDEQIENYRKTGIARLNGYTFMQRDPGDFSPDGPDYYYIYHSGQMATDGDDIAKALNGIRDDRESWIENLRGTGNLHFAEIPVESIAFVPVNLNLTQPEFVAEYNPRVDAAERVSFSRRRTIDDSGRQYTPEQERMHRNVGREVEEPTLRESLQNMQQDLAKGYVQGLFDQFDPIKSLDTQAYMLARLSKGAAGAIEAFLHHGKLKLNNGAYDTNNDGGVVEKLAMPLRNEMGDFLWWVAANRAERLAGEGRENLFSPDDIRAGKALDQGTSNFDYTIQHGARAGQTTRDRTLIYRDALTTFNEFNKNALDMAEQSGLIDGAQRQQWEHEFYVPFYRVSEEDGEFIGAKISNQLVRQRAFKQLKGGTEKLNSDLLHNTMMNWAHLIDSAAKNRAAVATLQAAERIGVAATGTEDQVRQAAKAAGQKSQVVWTMEGGQQKYYHVTDKPVFVALTSLEYSGMRGPIMDAMSAFKKWLTIGVTASPYSKIRNLIRDSVQAIATSELGYNPAANIAEGWRATDRKSNDYASMLASGALIRFGTMEGSEADKVRRLVKSGVKDNTILNSTSKTDAVFGKLKTALEAYHELGNRGEEINRAALYQQLRNKGMSHLEASYAARDLMDFSMQGTWTTVRFLTQVVPFMNARLQGLYKLGKSAKEDPRKMGAVLGAVALASIALMLAYKDDEDWKKREDWDRDNYWWFKFGGMAYRIPKPFEIGAVATLAERGVEYFASPEMTGKRFLDRLKAIASDQLSMNPIPQAVKPLVDIYANKDSFTNRPIETMGMEKLQPQYRHTASTSMVARGLSTATGGVLSPVQYDHLIQGYFSWLGTMVVGAADLATRPLTNEPVQAAPDYWKKATGGMVAELPADQSRYVTQVYDQAKELEQAYGTYRQLVKEGRTDEARDFFQSNIDEMRRYKSVEKVKQAEARINESIRMIERSSKFTADEKRQRIQQLEATRDRAARSIAPGLR